MKKSTSKNEDSSPPEDIEAMDVDDTPGGEEGFHSQKDKEDWKDLLKNCGLSNVQTSKAEVENGKLSNHGEFKKPSNKKGKKNKQSLGGDNALAVDSKSENASSKEPSSQEEISTSTKKSKKKQKKKKKISVESGPSNNNDQSSHEEATLIAKEPSNTSVVNYGHLGFSKLSPPDRSFCLVKQNNSKWYSLLEELTAEVIASSADVETEPMNEYWSEKMTKYASRLHQKEEELFKNLSMKTSQYAWSEKILSSTKHGGGTLKDKLNIHTVRLMESPLHHLKSLEVLIGHVNVKSRRPMSLSMDILSELFISDLLIPGQKLKSFLKNPFKAMNPSISPEKRDRLILLWYFESQLKEYYVKFLDALKEVSMDQIEKTKMDAMSKTLSLLVANPEMENILLERLVNKLGDPIRSVASRAIYQLSTLLEKHHPAMKIVVVKEVERLLFRNNVNPKAQYYGICFLSQIMLASEGEEDIAKKLIQIYFSFFKSSIKKGEIDSKLMSGLLTGVNRAIPYAKNLLTDPEFQGHVGTLYKVVHMSSFNIGIQALSLLFQTDGEKGRYFSALYKKCLDNDLVDSSKQALFFNLIFKTLKTDPEPRRIKAFIKRLLGVSSMFKPPLACAILFLISEVVKARSDLQLFTRESLAVDMSVFDGDEEESSDVREEENKSSSWVHAKNLSTKKQNLEAYDPFSRNPLYSGAELSHLWELNYLRTHCHPSVALFAFNVSSQVPVAYSGDPLADFTLIRFLDRFVFRNPKKQVGPKKHPLSKRENTSSATTRGHSDESYIQAEESTIPKDELFIYKYLKKRDEKKRAGEGEESWEHDSVTSEEFDQYLDRMADFGNYESVDFAENVSQDKKGGIGVKKKSNAQEEDSEEESEDDLEDEDIEDDNEEFEDGSGESDLDEEAFEDAMQDDEDDLEESTETTPRPAFKKSSSSKKWSKKGSNDLQSLLASAEEFAEMIEDDEATADAGSSGAVSNRDNSGLRQLKWEKERDNSGKGFKRKKRGPFVGGKKRPRK